jgi:trimeric autotransporter adhesin
LGISANYHGLVAALATVLTWGLSGAAFNTRAQTAHSSQTPPQKQTTAESGVPAAGGRIHGTVKDGTIPLGGARVTVINPRSKKIASVITDGAGAYSIHVTQNGRFVILVVFRGLTAPAQQVVFRGENHDREADFSFDIYAGTNNISSIWPALIQPPVNVSSISMLPAAGPTGGTSGAQFPSFIGDPVFSGDTFTVYGQVPIVIPYFQMADQMRSDFEDGHQLQGTSVLPGEEVSSTTTTTNGTSTGATSTTASSNTTQAHGEVFWNGGNSIFNAKPFVLAGQQSGNPSYSSNSYGVTLGFQPFLPGLTTPTARDYLLLSYSGQLSNSLVNQFGVVPTEEEREGNFSQLVGSTGQLIPIYPPRSTVPYPNNTIDTPLNAEALNVLNYIPEPNLLSTGINYRLLTTQRTHANTIGASYTHTFGALPSSGSQGNVVPAGQLTQSLNVNFNLGKIATDVVNIFPQLGGRQRVQGYSITAGYTVLKGEWITSINFASNRNNSKVTNYFTNHEDIASQLGIYAQPTEVPININPLNYGLPNMIFNNFTGLSQTQPNFQLTQTTGLSGTSSWTHRDHILRFGGDVHRIDYDLFGGTDATGTFIFTGAYTAIEGPPASNPVAPTGSSFADFLLGLQQESKIEAPDQKAYMRQTNWDLFLRDDWRILNNLTICLGVRYDYFSPFVENHNRLSTLDYNSDFSDVQPVQPNGVGPVSGMKYSRGLVNPDRNNWSPHVGIAWQATKKTVVRGAYTINYAVGQYGTFIQNLAYQPPFADVQVNQNAPHEITPYTLQYGFGNFADDGNYAINPKYRVPYVQTWYLDIQQSLPLALVLDVGYVGAKGTRLDVISAPGFINNNLPFASAYFDFEDSTAFSNFNALVLRLTKNISHGLALQATYEYSHSIDDASSTNAGTVVVAQNWQNIFAEESNSSFDIRHQVTGNFLYQLPFGPGKPFLNQHNWAGRIFGGWSASGFFTLATGLPLTPYVSAATAEVARGTHGSVRPDRVPGTSITAGGGKIDHWFNTSAFSTDFASGQLYGDASRYSIPGPGLQNVNLSVSKLFMLKDTRSMEVRATANNAFNIVQFSGVNTQIGSSTFGYVNAVQSMRQLTFLARFRF